MRNLPPLVPDPVIEVYKQKVDRAVLRENLKLTVEERLLRMERLARPVARVCELCGRAFEDGQNADLVEGGSHI